MNTPLHTAASFFLKTRLIFYFFSASLEKTENLYMKDYNVER